MIEWLIQSTADHPALAAGIAPAGLLSEQEQDRLAELKSAKRRSDWLIGRWTAKRLVQAYIERRTGIQPRLNTLTIANDPDGAPRVIADCRLQIADCRLSMQSPISNLQSLSLSISHCNGYAFCALTDTPDVRIGVDIERIEPRAPRFAEDYFTAGELSQVRAAQPARRDAIVTLIWSAKEAALKALHLGLTVDTRSISCAIDPARHWCGWTELAVIADPQRLTIHDRQIQMGWWRIMSNYVLTLVVMRTLPRSPTYVRTLPPYHLVREG